MLEKSFKIAIELSFTKQGAKGSFSVMTFRLQIKRLLGRKEPVLSRVALGKTGLKISRMGFGLGGRRRGGFNTAKSLGRSQVNEAWRLGIRYFDTAWEYGNEKGLRQALGAGQEDCLISSKLPLLDQLGSQSLEEHLRRSLDILKKDCLDICFLHRPVPEQYEDIRSIHHPALLRLKEKGLVKAIGLTEPFTKDPQHTLLRRALEDKDFWDVFMVGYNFINSSASSLLFPEAQRQGVGLIGMFAVRNVFSQPERFRSTLDSFVRQGLISPVERGHPLLRKLEGFSSGKLTDYAYRYALSEPALHCVLMGTSSPQHLAQNVASAKAALLPAEEVTELKRIFVRCELFSGD